MHLHECDHGIDGDAIWLRLTEKMRRSSALRRIIRLPLRPVVAGGTASLLPQVAELGRAYLAVKAALDGKQLLFIFQRRASRQPSRGT